MAWPRGRCIGSLRGVLSPASLAADAGGAVGAEDTRVAGTTSTAVGLGAVHLGGGRGYYFRFAARCECDVGKGTIICAWHESFEIITFHASASSWPT